MFSLLERYVLHKFLIAFFVATCLTILVVWVIRAVQEVDVVLTNIRSIFVYLQITLFGIPAFAIVILPLALTLSAMYTIRTMNEDSELTVTGAAGFSRWVLLKPFLFVAFLCSFIIYLLSLWFSPLSMQEMRSRLTSVRADLVGTVLESGEFRKLTSGVILHFRSRGPDGALRGLFIRDTRTSDEIIYLSSEAYLRTFSNRNFLILRDGQVHRRTATDISTIDFTSYTYDLSTLTSGSVTSGSTHREISTYDLLTLPAESLPTGSPRGHYRAELHNRLISGLYPFIFVFLVVAILGYPQSSRESNRPLRLLSISLAVSIRITGIVLLERARYDADAVLLVWLLPFFSLLLAFLLFCYPASTLLRFPRLLLRRSS